MNFTEKSLTTLELPSVLQLLSQEAVGETAKERALALAPAVNAAEVQRRLAETTAAKTMMVVRGSPSFSGIKDVRAALSRADLGGTLNTTELLSIARVLQCARLVRGYIADDTVGKTPIDFMFFALHANKFLEEKITTSIIGEDEIADSASSTLASIRRQMRATAARAREALQKIISSPTYAKVLQEPIITMRSDRFVVPVKAEHKGAVPGLVHDISATGMTLFIEPMGAVKANNELRELAAKEKLEVERILAELSADCAEHRADIDADYEMLVALDLIFAKAKLSYRLNCQEAAIAEKGIVLRKARHPLLDQGKAVPIDVELGDTFDTLVITGPNTGGKTVSLKTIGLLSAMNQCGLHIPAADGSSLPVFSHILADIGDEQSIEQSLSTFSSHMTHTVKILEQADENSLVLFDELGAGTDPTEGAALAMAILTELHNRGARVMTTSHYAELKVFAMTTPGVVNACCEFNVETLSPTYRLLVGIPGKSNAFAISKKLGLSDMVIQMADSFIGVKDRNFEDMMADLEVKRQLMEQELADARAEHRKASEERTEWQKKNKNFDDRKEQEMQKMRAEARAILEDAKETADETIRRMRQIAESSGNAAKLEDNRRKLREKLDGMQEKQKIVPKKQVRALSAKDLHIGDSVMVLSMNLKGTIHTLPNAKGDCQVTMGIMTAKVNLKDLELLPDEEDMTAKKKGGGVSTMGLNKAAYVSPEINLVGKRVDEALAELDKYLDDAYLAHLAKVTVIHGRGTGALRQAVQNHCKRLSYVKSCKTGEYGEGDHGVTIVEFK